MYNVCVCHLFVNKESSLADSSEVWIHINQIFQIYLVAQNNPKQKNIYTNDFTDKSTRQTRVLAIGLKGRKTALT